MLRSYDRFQEERSQGMAEVAFCSRINCHSNLWRPIKSHRDSLMFIEFHWRLSQQEWFAAAPILCGGNMYCSVSHIERNCFWLRMFCPSPLYSKNHKRVTECPPHPFHSKSLAPSGRFSPAMFDDELCFNNMEKISGKKRKNPMEKNWNLTELKGPQFELHLSLPPWQLDMGNAAPAHISQGVVDVPIHITDWRDTHTQTH